MFSSHEKFKYLINDNCDINQILISDNKKYSFKCPQCNHIIKQSPYDIINRNRWCKYCSNQSLCDSNECLICYSKSFQSSNFINCWSSKNIDLSARQTFKHSFRKLYFNCYSCNHIIYTSPNSLKEKCCYCSKSNRKLCSDNNCNMCFNNSFASNEKSKFWSVKNSTSPRNVSKYSSKDKYIFICEDGHEFYSYIDNISYGQWCSYCKNKTEKYVYNTLKIYYNSIISQYSDFWSINEKTNRYYKYDFFIPDYNIIIELDGDQHFKQISNWEDYKIRLKKDIYKMNIANSYGLSIIRIVQKDVSKRNEEYWLTEINKAIENINREFITTGKVNNIFICQNNEYKEYLEILK